MLIIMAAMLIFGFSFATLAIDSALYHYKRAQLDALAKSIASAAAHSLPHRGDAATLTGTIGAAVRWYNALRFSESGAEIAPVVSSCTPGPGDGSYYGTLFYCGSGTPYPLEINFNENIPAQGVPYSVYSVKINIKIPYKSIVFLPLVTSSTITGSGTVQFAPTDVVMVVENSASFIDSTDTPSIAAFTSAYSASKATAYARACFSKPWRNFKRGVMELYDRLSQNETFRVGVITLNSISGDSMILADLGQKSTTASELPRAMLNYDDVPDYFSTRCAAGTVSGGSAEFPIPDNLNTDGGTWNTARTSLTSLQPHFNPGGAQNLGNFSMPSNTSLLIREAIWILEAGYLTPAGYIPPRYKFQGSGSALDMAKRMLYQSRRADNLPVQHRVILYFTDDAGLVPAYGTGSELPTAVVTSNICAIWNDVSNATARSQVKLGVVYFGNNPNLYAHNYADNAANLPIGALRSACLVSEVSGTNMGTFFAEHSPTSPFIGSAGDLNFQDQFYLRMMPYLAEALKEIEYRKS